MSEKLTEIRDSIQTFRPKGDHPEDFHRVLDILLEIVAELERIDRAAQMGALSAFASPNEETMRAFRLRQEAGLAALPPIVAPEASKSLPEANPAQGGASGGQA